jgi:uncharacterized Fe-S cluster-containing MiaB family protein
MIGFKLRPLYSGEKKIHVSIGLEAVNNFVRLKIVSSMHSYVNDRLQAPAVIFRRKKIHVSIGLEAVHNFVRLKIVRSMHSYVNDRLRAPAVIFRRKKNPCIHWTGG